MGIYIKKVLGYGLQMTSAEASELLNDDAVKKRYSMTGIEYLDFLKAKYADANEDDPNYYLNDLHSSDLYEMPKYHASDFITVVDTTEEDPNSDLVWVVITPPLVCEEWKHNDDPIDHYEESLRYQDSEFRLDQNIQFFNHGLYPYEGSYVNHATGETVDSQRLTLVRRYLKLKGPELDQTLRLLLATLKISSVEEFHDLIHPAPPVSVIDIAEWTGIFKDASVAPKLRPALLKYWS